MGKLAMVAGALAIALGGCTAVGDISTSGQSSRAGDDDNDVENAGDPEWTLLFYLAADNEQEAYADTTIANLLEASAEVENQAQIIVLIDRLSTSGTEVAEIEDGQWLPLATYPEQETSDAAVLADFVRFGLDHAEHERTALVIKSEGFAWRGIGRDNTHEPDMPDTLMPPGAIADALVAAQADSAKEIDLLVLEGSIMAFMEVVYELRDAAPYLVTTQSKIQPDGIPWQTVLRGLGSTPDASAAELAIEIVDDHIDYYGDKGNNGNPAADTSVNFAAMTAFDLSHMDEVAEAHWHWAEVTYSLFDDLYNVLPHARDLSDVGGYGEITEFDYQSDIWAFMEQGLALIEDAELSFPELDAAVADYMAAYRELAFYERHADKFRWVAHGLGIWYPPTWNKYETRDASDEVFGSNMFYEDPDIGLDWVTDSTWLTYLFEYFDRADANLAGDGIGSGGDEPPKPGVDRRLDAAAQ